MQLYCHFHRKYDGSLQCLPMLNTISQRCKDRLPKHGCHGPSVSIGIHKTTAHSSRYGLMRNIARVHINASPLVASNYAVHHENNANCLWFKVFYFALLLDHAHIIQGFSLLLSQLYFFLGAISTTLSNMGKYIMKTPAKTYAILNVQ